MNEEIRYTTLEEVGRASELNTAIHEARLEAEAEFEFYFCKLMSELTPREVQAFLEGAKLELEEIQMKPLEYMADLIKNGTIEKATSSNAHIDLACMAAKVAPSFQSLRLAFDKRKVLITMDDKKEIETKQALYKDNYKLLSKGNGRWNLLCENITNAFNWLLSFKGRHDKSDTVADAKVVFKGNDHYSEAGLFASHATRVRRDTFLKLNDAARHVHVANAA